MELTDMDIAEAKRLANETTSPVVRQQLLKMADIMVSPVAQPHQKDLICIVKHFLSSLKEKGKPDCPRVRGWPYVCA